MRFLRANKSNIDCVTQALLKKLNVKVNTETITESLQNHPDYPSLLAVSSFLTELDMAHQSFKFKIELSSIRHLPFPFIAQFKDDGGKLVIFNSIENGRINISDEKKENQVITEADFLKHWTGAVLFAEADEDSGEKNYNQNRIKYFFEDAILPLCILLFLTIYGIIVANQPFSWPYLILSLVKLIGLGISILLLVQSINLNNPFMQNLCSFGGKNNCNVILKSDAAKVTSWLSWSEVGFFYLAGSLLSLIFAPSSLFFLAWLNVFTLPYTIYSISYQTRNKNWCVLCCAIQLVLCLEFITALGFGLLVLRLERLPDFPTFGLLFLSFLSPIVIWSFLKPFFLNAAKLKPLQNQLKKFKYNDVLFNQVLTNQPYYAVTDELMPVVLGNPEAETIITMVSNPFCGPCGKAHQTIGEWLKVRDDIQLKIVFTTANNENDQRTRVAQHVSALSTLQDKNIVENALNDWYKQDNKKHEAWAEKYPISFNGGMTKITEKQKAWCEMAEIKFTPTILINGYKLPEPYRLEDLKYLLT